MHYYVLSVLVVDQIAIRAMEVLKQQGCQTYAAQCANSWKHQMDEQLE